MYSISNVIYACYIGDGYAEVERPTEPDGPEEGASYWYTPRNAEVGCPSCGQDGTFTTRRGTRDCRTCDGAGLVSGEPFTVTRYVFDTPEAAEQAYSEVEATGDGYERAAVLARWVASGRCVATVVIEWDPEHDHDDGSDDTDDDDATDTDTDDDTDTDTDD